MHHLTSTVGIVALAASAVAVVSLLIAATVAYRVGYEDASHFSREYKRLFGFPPLRDVERLRASVKIGF